MRGCYYPEERRVRTCVGRLWRLRLDGARIFGSSRPTFHPSPRPTPFRHLLDAVRPIRPCVLRRVRTLTLRPSVATEAASCDSITVSGTETRSIGVAVRDGLVRDARAVPRQPGSRHLRARTTTRTSPCRCAPPTPKGALTKMAGRGTRASAWLDGPAARWRPPLRVQKLCGTLRLGPSYFGDTVARTGCVCWSGGTVGDFSPGDFIPPRGPKPATSSAGAPRSSVYPRASRAMREHLLEAGPKPMSRSSLARPTRWRISGRRPKRGVLGSSRQAVATRMSGALPRGTASASAGNRR